MTHVHNTQALILHQAIQAKAFLCSCIPYSWLLLALLLFLSEKKHKHTPWSGQTNTTNKCKKISLIMWWCLFVYFNVRNGFLILCTYDNFSNPFWCQCMMCICFYLLFCWFSFSTISFMNYLRCMILCLYLKL